MIQYDNVLSIQYPIIQGGMGNISNVPLASAVSNAGGLGTIGCGTMGVAEVEALIIAMKEKTTKPFAINVPINVNEQADDLIELAITHKVPVVSLSAGNPAKYIAKLHEHNITVIVVVAAVRHAEKAQEAGADLLVAEGVEAAGINSAIELTTLTLIPQIVKAVNIPVYAAGGIASGAGLAAVRALGASGIQMGTRFVATQEMVASDVYKNRLVTASDQETMVLGRSVGQVRRVLQSDYAKAIAQQEQEGIALADYQYKTSEVFHLKGALEGNEQEGFMNSGQIAGLIEDLPTVAQLIEGIMTEYKTTVEALAKTI